jgi:putative tricarboxylic transport membrane protein
LIPLFVWALRMPFTILVPMVFTLCIVGGYAPNQTMHDVWLIVIFGLFGYLLRKLQYPLAPLVLAVVLGPIMEKAFRQALISAQGDPLTFIERPLSATFVGLAALLFVLPLLKPLWRRRKTAAQPAD